MRRVAPKTSDEWYNSCSLDSTGERLPFHSASLRKDQGMYTPKMASSLLGISLIASSFLLFACSPPHNNAASSTSNEGGGGNSGGAGGGTAPEDILAALTAIPGLSVGEQPSQFEGYRRFLLEFDQPADH